MQLGQATLSLVSGPRFRTSLRVAAKDASPLTALVADNTALPQWLIDAVSTKGFEATGEMVATPSVVALRSVRAHAEGADAAFEFGKIRKDRKEWAESSGYHIRSLIETTFSRQKALFGDRLMSKLTARQLQEVGLGVWLMNENALRSIA